MYVCTVDVELVVVPAFIAAAQVQARSVPHGG